MFDWRRRMGIQRNGNFGIQQIFVFESVFSRMRSKGSRFTLGVWGLRVCSLDVAQPSATVRKTVRNRPREGHTAEEIIFEVSNFALLGFALQLWHFVTFRRVL